MLFVLVMHPKSHHKFQIEPASRFGSFDINNIPLYDLGANFRFLLHTIMGH